MSFITLSFLESSEDKEENLKRSQTFCDHIAEDNSVAYLLVQNKNRLKTDSYCLCIRCYKEQLLDSESEISIALNTLNLL